MEIKSIFDGWQYQCFFTRFNGIERCANGFLLDQWSNGLLTSNEVYSIYHRIGRFIQKNYTLPEKHVHEGTYECLRPKRNHLHAIVYANNNLKLTPDDFRRIDRETQLAEGMAAVEKLVNECEAVTA